MMTSHGRFQGWSEINIPSAIFAQAAVTKEQSPVSQKAHAAQ